MPTPKRSVVLISYAIGFVVLIFGGELLARVYETVKTRDPAWLAFGSKRLSEGIFLVKHIAFDDREGYRKFKPGQYTEQTQNKAEINVNALGFRGKEVTVQKPEGTIRLVALGGSTTLGNDVNDDETYPAMLETLLNVQGRQNDRFEVLNMGIPSAGLKEFIAMTSEEVVPLKPDLCLVMTGVNNYFFSALRLKGPLETTAYRIHYALYYRSLLYTLIREKIAQLTTGQALITNETERVFEPETFQADLKRFQETYRIFLDLMQSNNLRCVLIKQPLYLKGYPPFQDHAAVERIVKESQEKGTLSLYDFLYLEHSAFLDIQGELARQYRIPVVEATDFFDTLSPEEKSTSFGDFAHETEKGNQLLAEIVLQRITPLLGSLREAKRTTTLVRE